MFERIWTRLHPQNPGACTQHTSSYGTMWVYKKSLMRVWLPNVHTGWVFGDENDVQRTLACTWLPTLSEECTPKWKSYKILQT